MKIHRVVSCKVGQSLIEILNALGLASILLPALLTGLVASREGKAQEGQRLAATALLRQAEEAVRSVRENSWASITSTGSPFRPNDNGSSWGLLSGSEIIQGFTRQIAIADVNRDSNCNITASGGTLDPNTKKITTAVSWTGPPSGNVTSTEYLTNLSAKPKRGLLVYGDGGTTSNAIKYRTLNPCDGTWSTPNPTASGIFSTAAVRAARLYSSPTRNEKILVTRHVAGTNNQFIYAQVFNGSTWGNLVQLSSWSSSSFLNVRNFDGTYLTNGDFMVVYSDNSVTPKYRIWNGSSWGSQTNTANVGAIPTYIVAKARPSTNEVMMATFDQTSDTNTSYFNGSSWSAAVQHSTAAPTTTKEHIDFTWSPQNSLKGALVYPNGGSDSTQNLKVWTANGSGWSSTSDAPNLGGRLGPVDIDGRKGAETFMSCQKNANNKIGCFLANTTPGWSTPQNNTLTNNTEGGIQRSYNFAFEDSGSEGIVVYSDNTSTPKLKKYNSLSNSFDGSPSNLNTLSGVLTTIRSRPLSGSEDIFILMATGNTLYSLLWDGTNNAVYTSPAGQAFTTHGTNGSATTDFWYDFVWDKY